MNKITVGFALCAVLSALSFPTWAQQPKKIPRIGVLLSGSRSSTSTNTGAFRQGLRELGYVEGQNLLVEYRYAEGKLDHLPMLAAELVRLNVDIIVTASTAALLTLTPTLRENNQAENRDWKSPSSVALISAREKVAPYLKLLTKT